MKADCLCVPPSSSCRVKIIQQLLDTRFILSLPRRINSLQASFFIRFFSTWWLSRWSIRIPSTVVSRNFFFDGNRILWKLKQKKCLELKRSRLDIWPAFHTQQVVLRVSPTRCHKNWRMKKFGIHVNAKFSGCFWRGRYQIRKKINTYEYHKQERRENLFQHSLF